MSNSLEYIKGKKVFLKNYPQFDEAWLRDTIAKDPSMLGLGDLVLKDIERIQPKAGRLDLLFQHTDEDKRFEVEIMLGSVDESHIIRCIEYWDIERKRYPNYEHCAVLVAEDITARFLNVISLFNRTIPMIALQMNAILIENKILLHFTKVLDELSLSPVEEDEELSEREIADRPYWENRGSTISMQLLDQCLDILKQINNNLSFKYNKYYIGLVENNHVNNVITFRPKKKFLRVHLHMADLESLGAKFRDTDLDFSIDSKRNKLVLILNKGEVTEHKELLSEVFKNCYTESTE